MLLGHGPYGAVWRWGNGAEGLFGHGLIPLPNFGDFSIMVAPDGYVGARQASGSSIRIRHTEKRRVHLGAYRWCQHSNIDKRVVEVALTYIHGIGDSFAKRISSERPGCRLEKRVNELTDDEVDPQCPRDHRPDFTGSRATLRRDVAMNIKRLMDLGCYKGLRHRKGLPGRGQRTRTNARTRKGKARPIAGKKK